jgi:hypothetical protein
MGRWHIEPSIIVVSRLMERLEDSSDLRRKNVLISRVLGKSGTKATLGESESVMGCRVKISNATTPSGVDGGARLIIGNSLVEIAELCAAER